MASSDSQRDVIANYLLQTFIRGNDCDRPTEIRDDIHAWHDLARRSLHRPDFKQLPQSHQREIVYAGVEALLGVLQCTCEESKLDKLLDEISPKLEAVLNGESETLRPLLDILIERGVYPDPDPRSHARIVLGGHPFTQSESERAWQLEYQGRAHETLLQNIQTSFKKGVEYTNSGAIVQSSGYGKSRTADQMATLIPTIPMNIRDLADEKQGAFPPADATLVKMFNRIAASKDHAQLFLLFFKLLFELVRDLAKDFGGDDLTAGLYQYFKNRYRRATFFIDLSEKMALNSSKVDTQEAIASFIELAKLFPESEGDVKMVIYIDAAHTLTEKIDGTWSMYDHILHATAELATVGVFFLFISTDSRCEILANQPPLLVSYKFQVGGKLVAPFTEMPFDCHPSLVQKPTLPGLALRETQEFSFVVRFGRPLFWAYFEAGCSDMAILGMARAKLTPKMSWGKPDNLGKFAILDTLLNFELEPWMEHSHQLAAGLVDHHMRTVYSIPASHAYMHTGYPSEPILAEAALYLAEYYFRRSGSLLRLYNGLHQETADAIVQGERGETAGKVILLQAYIAAIDGHYHSRFNGSVYWGYGCSLVHFLTELTGEKFCRDVLTSVPDNLKGGTPLEERFKNSWVRFTHFARGADDSAMTSSMAWIAFVRGMAMIACPSQNNINVSIPILLDKDKPITEANMSSILVQFRGGLAYTSNVKAGVWEHEIPYFPPPNSSRDASADPGTSNDVKRVYHTRPYISLVMELGRLEYYNHESIPHEVVDILDESDSPPSESQEISSDVLVPPPQTRRQPSSDLIHPRYSLFYYGCSHNVYQCIPDSVNAPIAIRKLLQTPPVFERYFRRPIDPVLQMKPFWGAGSSSFSWIDEPYFKPTNQPPGEYKPEERVLVGTPDDFDLDIGVPC